MIRGSEGQLNSVSAATLMLLCPFTGYGITIATTQLVEKMGIGTVGVNTGLPLALILGLPLVQLYFHLLPDTSRNRLVCSYVWYGFVTVILGVLGGSPPLLATFYAAALIVVGSFIPVTFEHKV